MLRTVLSQIVPLTAEEVLAEKMKTDFIPEFLAVLFQGFRLPETDEPETLNERNPKRN